MRCGAYPSRDEIWNDEQEGRENNGLKWFEIIGKQGAILGWGKCSVDGTIYGGQWHSGQSPIDIIRGEEWTKRMMDIFVASVAKDGSSTSGATLAEFWVEAAHEVIGHQDYKNTNDSKFNAVGIGEEDGRIEVWALERVSSSSANTRRVWIHTP